MKRSLFLAMILLFGASSVCNISYAQTKREQRKAEKQFADLKKSSDIAQAIEDRSFSFIVTEINSTSSPDIANIPITVPSGLDIYPNLLKCTLPGYTPERQTTLRTQGIPDIDFRATDYTFESHKDGNDWEINIVASDPRSNNKYFIQLLFPSLGRNGELVIRTPSAPSVTYLGDIRLPSEE